MDDLVKRLRQGTPCRRVLGHGEYCANGYECEACRLRLEASDEIERLRQLHKSWRSGPPKEPGWYWTMWRGCHGPEAVKVIYMDRPELPGQVWYGPITVPPWLEHHPGDLPSEPPKPCTTCGQSSDITGTYCTVAGCPHSSEDSKIG